MAATARKSIKNDDLKKILPVKQALDFAKQVENNVHAFERGTVDGAAAVTENCCHMAEQWGGAYMQGVTSYVAKNGQSLHAAFDMGHKAVESFHKAAGDLMQISREAIDCRSFDELYNLQRKAASSMMSRWLEELHQMNCTLFGDYRGACVLPPD